MRVKSSINIPRTHFCDCRLMFTCAALLKRINLVLATKSQGFGDQVSRSHQTPLFMLMYLQRYLLSSMSL
jgi:hypothetical protein